MVSQNEDIISAKRDRARQKMLHDIYKHVIFSIIHTYELMTKNMDIHLGEFHKELGELLHVLHNISLHKMQCVLSIKRETPEFIL